MPQQYKRLTQVAILFILILWAALVEGWSKPACSLDIVDLKCEYRTTPLGIDTPNPYLSWILTSDERGQYQTCYHIIAASSLGRLDHNEGDLWDSGVVNSSNSINITYGGKLLQSGQRVYWKVSVIDRNGNCSRYSLPSWWEMGLLTPESWQAKWIAQREATISTTVSNSEPCAPLFRSEFVITQKVTRARIYVSGLGYYELHLNGSRVGDSVLDPGWTSYAKRVLYATYDVTRQIQQGQNAIGAMVGNGWFNPLPLKMWGKLNLREHLMIGSPRLILKLVLEFTDGTTKTIVTDENWKVHDGPVINNSVYLGEVYDARKEEPGWDLPGFNDLEWRPAVLASQALGELKAQNQPPIRITHRIAPVRITEPEKNVFIFDMGENFAGWVQLRVKERAGTKILLRYGELVYPDGTLDGLTSVCGQIKRGLGTDQDGLPQTAFQIDQYTTREGGEQIYRPHFTFHGFRYVEVTGLTSRPGLELLEGLKLNSDVAPVGTFECSNDMFNRIQKMVLRTELSNLFSVQSDCPHREKFGYGGDIVAAGEAAVQNFDMSCFYAKTVSDLADSVRPNGGFSETSPYVGISDEGLGDGSGPVGWGTAHPQLQWLLYRYYGNRRLLDEQYDITKKWITLLRNCATNDVLDNGISDHESLTPKPRALTGTAFYYLNLELFSKIAKVLGHEGDASQADAWSVQVKAAFNQHFLHPGTGLYDSGSQTCQVFAIGLDLVPPEELKLAILALTHDILDKNDAHLSTGIFGTKYLLEALSKNGKMDIAYQVANQKTFPGWGYMLERGATTLWEHWTFSDDIYSHNHPMFGSISEWFYHSVAGIDCAADAVGFDKIIIRPQPVGNLKWAKASYNSVHGKVVSEWNLDGNKFRLRIKIPVGATALISIPAKDIESTKVGDRSIAEPTKGIDLVEKSGSSVKAVIGSGMYQFVSVFR